MSEHESFRELIRRARQSDQEVWNELVQRFEPVIRRAAKVRLVDPRLKQARDSGDFCQSILLSLYLRLTTGQYELDTPEAFLKLLSTMVRNKVADYAQKEYAEKRDVHRTGPLGSDAHAAVDPGSSPSQQVEWRELVAKFREKLSPEIRRLAEDRKEGRSWDEIAKEWGESPAALNKRFQRAIDEAEKDLGLDG
jgi:RNA polymerase sigma-70 factor (ECF subfamily)